MALAITTRMSSPRRDNVIGSGPNRDAVHGDVDDMELKLLPEFSVENSTRAGIHSFSPLTIHQSPGNLFGDTSDPNEPTVAHESTMMPEPYSTNYGNDFFPHPYSNRDRPPQFPAYQQHIRSQFPARQHHTDDHPPSPSPPHHYGFEGDGPPPEQIRGGTSAFTYQNEGMHAPYAPHPSQEHYNYHRSFNTFDGPVYQYDHRDIPHNHSAADESMDQKPAAVDRHTPPAMYSHQHSYPQQAPSLPIYPTQDANMHRTTYPPYAEAFKKSTTASAVHYLDEHPPQENLKHPPRRAATSAATSEPAVRRGSRQFFDPPTSQSRGKNASTVKGSPKRKPRTSKKTYRAASTTAGAPVPTRATSRSSAYSSPSGKFAQLPPRQTSPTPEELAEARTPRKQDALINWFQRLNDLRQFKEENGHTNVPQQYPKNHSLGVWVNKQRMEKKAYDKGDKSGINEKKILLLEQAGFVWAKRKGQAAWEEKFLELQSYLQRHGHCNVPTKNKENRALGRWVSTQRSMFKKFQEEDINDVEVWDRRIRRLNGIGFSWSLAPSSPPSDTGGGEEQRDSHPFDTVYHHHRDEEDGDGEVGGSFHQDDEFSPNNNSEEV